MSICFGLSDIVARHLGISAVGSKPHYDHKRSCQQLSRSAPPALEVPALLGEMLNQIEDNWQSASTSESRRPSPENWRWTKQKYIRTTPPNPSAEKTLEKAIVSLTGSDWVNQIPTASGLRSATRDRHRNVDLGHRLRPGHFELIELKVASNTPLHALVEVLFAAVLYIHACLRYPEDLRTASELLKANEIEWKVLAPRDYYTPYDLGWLERAVSTGLRSFAERTLGKPVMTFAFAAFPEHFHWPLEDRQLLEALARITPVVW